jgi:hypothetical protein
MRLRISPLTCLSFGLIWQPSAEHLRDRISAAALQRSMKWVSIFEGETQQPFSAPREKQA